MEPQAQAQGRLERLLDVISLVRAVRAAFGGMDGGASLLMFVLALAGTLGFGVLTWHYDWTSTYNFTQGIAYGAQDVAYTVAEAAGNGADAEMLGGLIVVIITLIPTIVELVAPRVVHPGARLALQLCIGFDFVTDWGLGWYAATNWDALASWGAFRFVGEVATAFVVTLAASIFLQVLFVLCATATIVCALNIVGLSSRVRPTPQVIEINPRG